GPLVPDADAVLAQVGDVGLSLEEPEQLVHDRPEVQLLRGDQRKPLGQVEAHLPSEDRTGADAGPIRLSDAVVADMTHEVEVLSHRSFRSLAWLATSACAASAKRRDLLLARDGGGAARRLAVRRRLATRHRLGAGLVAHRRRGRSELRGGAVPPHLLLQSFGWLPGLGLVLIGLLLLLLELLLLELLLLHQHLLLA